MNAVSALARRIFSRRLGVALMWCFALFAVAVVVNAVGIRIVGSIEGWHRWLAEHTLHFTLWRVALYGATVYGWLWMRRRLLAREPGPGARQRVLRVEVAACAAVVALELSQWMQHA